MIRDGLKMNTCGRRCVQMNANGYIGVYAFGRTRKWGGQSHRGRGLSENMTTWPGNFPVEWTSAWVHEWCERMVCGRMSDCEQMCECICRCGQVCEWEHKSVSEYWVHNMWLYVLNCGREWIQVCGCVCVFVSACVCVTVCVCVCVWWVHVCVKVNIWMHMWVWVNAWVHISGIVSA